MRRPSREFKPESFELEGRLLLAAKARVPSLVAAPAGTSEYSYGVLAFGGFDTTPGTSHGSVFTTPGRPYEFNVALQGDGTATVRLTYTSATYPPPPTLQVVVATDPSSPAVGVNVEPVYQTITFDGEHTTAEVIVRIIADAPNPGEVEVPLIVTPIDLPPNVTIPSPYVLRILSSEDMLPPRVVSTGATPQGFQVRFNKPMDPAGANNVNNYQILKGMYIFRAPPIVGLSSAAYDPETYTVTLIPKRRPRGNSFTVVVQGDNLMQYLTPQSKVRGRRGPQPNPGPPLTDLHGNSPVDDQWVTPGTRYLTYRFPR